MAPDNSTTKRRQSAADTLHIGDLPIGFIVDVSAYLSKPSRAFLAAAFSTTSSSWQTDMHQPSSPISTAIVSASQWDTLDFEDVNKELANKLTDDDMYAILKSISAHDVLKKLKLCGCINITGIGLNPLRGSVVLEQIDISLRGKYEKPYPRLECKISLDVTGPILVSIISTDGCSLKYIQFPGKWTWFERDRREKAYLQDIVRIYNQRLNNRDVICSKCNADIQGIGDWNWMNSNLQNIKICYDCLGPMCSDCRLNDVATGHLHESSANLPLNCCETCDKTYCTDCIPGHGIRCTFCRRMKCGGCGDGKACDECETTDYCDHCVNRCDGCDMSHCFECVSYHRCEGDDCDKAHCEDCYDGEEYSVEWCRECETAYCIECKVKNVKSGVGNGCHVCQGDTVPVILEENKKLVKENAELREGNEKMVELRKENKELREKLKQKEAEVQRRKEEFEKEMEDILTN